MRCQVTLFVLLVLLSLPIVSSCSQVQEPDPSDWAQQQEEDPPLPDPVDQGPGGEGPAKAYATHVCLYGNYLATLDQDRLENMDVIILGAQNLALLEERFLPKVVLSMNMWGYGSYSNEGHDWFEWQPGPGDIGEPDVVLHERVHCYRFDNAHVEEFLGWVEAWLQDYGDRVQGVFLDDFGFDRTWWSGPDENKDQVWGAYDGLPSWREDPGGWNVTRVQAVEAGALALVRQYIGPQGLVIVNGPARTLDGVTRFAENVGAPLSEAWDRLEVPGVDNYRYAKSGDLLMVWGMGASGAWGDWSDSPSGNGWENLVRASNLAMERGCNVGLAFGEPPTRGGSIYQLLLDPADPESTWPGYWIRSD